MWVTGILSALIGASAALATIFLGRRSETLKQLQVIRTAAYADFIRAVAGLAALQREPLQEREHFIKGWEFKMLLADAKARIAMYGGEAVASALSEFLREGATIDSAKRAKDFAGVCEKMREDSGAKGKIASRDMHFLLFDFDEKSYLNDVIPRS